MAKSLETYVTLSRTLRKTAILIKISAQLGRHCEFLGNKYSGKDPVNMLPLVEGAVRRGPATEF